jgi:hypothetical protein
MCHENNANANVYEERIVFEKLDIQVQFKV